MEGLTLRLYPQRTHPTPTPTPAFPPRRLECSLAESSWWHRLVENPHPEECEKPDGEHRQRTDAAATSNSAHGNGVTLIKGAHVVCGCAVLRATVRTRWGTESGGNVGDFTVPPLYVSGVATADIDYDRTHKNTHGTRAPCQHFHHGLWWMAAKQKRNLSLT